ncbi:MAG TPA: ATP-binding protein [Vicinamibacterales bacterium]|nr:ATP-binding protein [Vicinamibacterales bacterium]
MLSFSSSVRPVLTFTLVPLFVGVALWLELWLARASTGFLFFAFSPAVALSALIGGFRAGALALLLAGVASDYYLLGPGDLFHFDSLGQALALSGFFAAWLPMTILAERMHRVRRRKEAEQIAATRAALQADRLEQLTAALAKATRRSAAVEACVQEAAHWLRAPAASLLLLNETGTAFELSRAIGYPADLHGSLQAVPLDGGGPLGDALQRRAPVILESEVAWRTEYGDDAARQSLPGHPAMIALPLVGASGVVAILRLDFQDERTFSPDDREFLTQLGWRGAQAIERTRQYEFAERAREEAERLRVRADDELEERLKIEQALRTSETRYRALAARTSRLHSLTAALSEAVTVQAVAKAVVHRGRTAVGATAADVARLVEDGTVLETLYAEPPDNVGVRIPVTPGWCATDAVQSRTPVFVKTFDDLQQRYWRSAPAAADGGYASAAVLPLVVEGQAIGVLSFHFTVPVSFDEEYEALLISVAQHCAQALDRARLYETAQRARAEAETANRLKDDFLSIVSHELRTPLTSILGWTSILQKPAIDGAVATRALQAIRENAERQARLIDDLLDFSRITAGRLTLDRQRLNVRDLLRGALEAVVPVAAAKGVELRHGDVPPAVVIGDMRRLEQVFLNLLGNALKFTPAGGFVEMRAALAGDLIEVSVRDTGAGIHPDFLPHVFERFRQGESTATRTHDGVGLGLSIARQLVEAHGGTIHVRSGGTGEGATFTVALPLARGEEGRPAAGAAAPQTAAVHEQEM